MRNMRSGLYFEQYDKIVKVWNQLTNGLLRVSAWESPGPIGLLSQPYSLAISLSSGDF